MYFINDHKGFVTIYFSRYMILMLYFFLAGVSTLTVKYVAIFLYLNGFLVLCVYVNLSETTPMTVCTRPCFKIEVHVLNLIMFISFLSIVIQSQPIIASYFHHPPNINKRKFDTCNARTSSLVIYKTY